MTSKIPVSRCAQLQINHSTVIIWRLSAPKTTFNAAHHAFTLFKWILSFRVRIESFLPGRVVEHAVKAMFFRHRRWTVSAPLVAIVARGWWIARLQPPPGPIIYFWAGTRPRARLQIWPERADHLTPGENLSHYDTVISRARAPFWCQCSQIYCRVSLFAATTCKNKWENDVVSLRKNVGEKWTVLLRIIARKHHNITLLSHAHKE